MPPKKWSRKEEKKKVKDIMTEIQQKGSDLAELSKRRRQVLRAAVPGIHRQEANDVLQSAEDWNKFYNDEATWLQQKAKSEAQQSIDDDEEMIRLQEENAGEVARLQEENAEEVARLQEENAEMARMQELFEDAVIDVKTTEKQLAELEKSYERMKKLNEASEKSNARLNEDLKATDATHKTEIQIMQRDERKMAAQEKDGVQSELDALKLKFSELQTSSANAQQKHDQDMAEKESNLDDFKSKYEKNRASSIKAQQKFNADIAAKEQKLNEAMAAKEQKFNEAMAAKERELDEAMAAKEQKHDEAMAAKEQKHDEAIAAKEHVYEADRQKAAQEKREMQSKLDALQTDLDNLNGHSRQSEVDRRMDQDRIKILQASLAGERKNLGNAKDQAARDSIKITDLETELGEEKQEVKKATLQLQEVDDQYSLLAKHNVTKTPTISSRPIQELKAILIRAAGLSQSTSNIEAARILDSTNTDLSEGTQLIADSSPNVFILVVSGKVEIFDKADIYCVEHDTLLNIRLITDEKSLLVCGHPRNTEKRKVWENWRKRYAVL